MCHITFSHLHTHGLQVDFLDEMHDAEHQLASMLQVCVAGVGARAPALQLVPVSTILGAFARA